MTRFALVLSALVVLAADAVYAQVQVQGRVVDQDGLPLPGVGLRLSATSGSTGSLTAVSAGDGTFTFDAAPGGYRLESKLDGFVTRIVDVQATEPLRLPDIVMTIAPLVAETTVVARAPTEVQPKQFGAPATISERVIENAPLRGNRYDDMLPLVPNVVRGPDGLISVAGARAPQGVVLVNGSPASDLASGDPVAPVPLGAVDAVQVITTGFPAEYGPSTGGVTIINSRPGGDAFRFAINSFTPRPRLRGGTIEGIEAWEPNLSLRGPILRGRAWFAQSLDYKFERTLAETVVGAQDRERQGFTSFTQIDGKAGSNHTLTGWISGDDHHVHGERLGAFTPLGTVPDLDRSSWSVAGIDRAVFGVSTLETRLVARRQETRLSPDGVGAYFVGHDVARGAYFGGVHRRALAAEASAVFSRASAGRLGRHVLKTGVLVTERQLDGVEQNNPVTYLRSSGVPAMTVAFVGPGSYDASSARVGAFAQDAWDLTSRMVLDLGLRFDHDQHAGTLFGPRGGVTWLASDRVTVTAGLGWFAGELPLAALGFEGFQRRQVVEFDEAGVPTGPAVTDRHVVAAEIERTRARLASARVDWRIGAGWQLRGAVQERHGTREAIVERVLVVGQEALARLSTDGRSRTRSLEVTLGYRAPRQEHQVYLSYVTSSARGNTNDFGQVEGLFRDPRLAAPEDAPLPADVPHRVLAWGVFALPWQVTVAPFLDVRSGFPYSAVEDDWSYSGPRMSQRFPLFASLDLVVNKVATLPGGIRARVGIKLYNVVGRRNGRQIQADVDRPDFGRTYNALGRQVRGVFEIIWSGSRK